MLYKYHEKRYTNYMKGDLKMVTAIVLINVERHQVNEAAKKLADMQGISEVYSVSGRYDLAAIIRVNEHDALADLVAGHLLKLDGILKTETMLAFRTYSAHDLESMFSLGFEENA